MFNHKPKAIDKNLFLNITNKTNFGFKTNLINKNILIKRYNNLRNAGMIKNNKLYNFTPTKKLNKISSDALIMPLLNYKNSMNNSTFQDVISEL